jgi:hypothetical protein
LKLAHGADCVHGFASDPDGETNTDAAEGVAHALVVAATDAFPDRFPAASYASTANV